jgi:hypothetical protein
MKKSMTCLGIAVAMTTFGRAAWPQECSMATPQSAEHNDHSASTGSPPASPDETNRTLLSNDVAHGGYGGPQVKLTALAEQAALLVGGRGAWIIGHSLTIGGAGYGLPTRIDAPQQAQGTATDAALSFGYGGFQVGYIVFPHDVIHFSGSLLIGGGGVSIVERRGQSDSQTVDSAALFVLEPEVAMEINITRTIRGVVDLSYRYVSNSGIPGLSSSRLGGPATGAALAFGWF